MDRHRLCGAGERGTRAEPLDHDRGVDELASAALGDELDVGVTEDLGEERRSDVAFGNGGQLAAVRERDTAVVGVREPRDRDGVQREAARIVEADHDVLTGRVDGDRDFRLTARGPGELVVRGGWAAAWNQRNAPGTAGARAGRRELAFEPAGGGEPGAFR